MRHSLAAALLLVAAPAAADPMLDLAQARQCLNCHAPDKFSLAPSFRSIAAKYRSHPESAEALAAKVMKGVGGQGGFHWGSLKTPKQAGRYDLSAEEARQLVDWILARK
jgi:cytochrome c